MGCQHTRQGRLYLLCHTTGCSILYKHLTIRQRLECLCQRMRKEFLMTARTEEGPLLSGYDVLVPPGMRTCTVLSAPGETLWRAHLGGHPPKGQIILCGWKEGWRCTVREEVFSAALSSIDTWVVMHGASPGSINRIHSQGNCVVKEHPHLKCLMFVI